MLTRTLTASVLPRAGRWRAVLPSLSSMRGRLVAGRRRSLLIQERSAEARGRCARRHGYGRRA